MKIHIPALGSQFTLTENWAFKLYGSWGNSHFLEMQGHARGYGQPDNSDLPAGTVLKVAKYQLIKGRHQYVKLRVMDGPRNLLSKARGGTATDSVTFYVPLEEFNKVEIEDAY